MSIPYWAGHYIGVPFSEHGRTIRGLDCWGLVRLILLEQFNISVPSYGTYYKDTKNEKQLGPLVSRESQKWIPVALGSEKCGDVIVLRVRGVPMHVGFVLGDKSMLHIENHINSAIEKYDGRRWKDRITGIFRHRHSTKTAHGFTQVEEG